jgi:hypothetical protein
MDEGRKRVLLIAARKLWQFNPDLGRVLATMVAITDAVEWGAPDHEGRN